MNELLFSMVFDGFAAGGCSFFVLSGKVPHGLAGSLADWLAGCMAGWLPGWLAGRFICEPM